MDAKTNSVVKQIGDSDLSSVKFREKNSNKKPREEEVKFKTKTLKR